MSDLESKANKRYFVVPPKQVKLKKPKKVDLPEPKNSDVSPKIIIGDTKSAGPFVKEQTIKLNPDVGDRGGETGASIGSRTKQSKRKTNLGNVGSMGGRHSRAPR